MRFRRQLQVVGSPPQLLVVGYLLLLADQGRMMMARRRAVQQQSGCVLHQLLPELVQQVLLAAGARGPLASVCRAAAGAEASRQRAEQQEAQLVQRLCQVSCRACSTPHVAVQADYHASVSTGSSSHGCIEPG